MTRDELIKTRKWLKRYRHMKQELAARTKNYDEFVQEIYNPLCSPKLDGMPRGSTATDQTAATVEQIHRGYGEILKLLERKMEALRDAIKEIEDTIGQLDADERCVLYHRYILGIYWANLPAYINYDERQCRRIEKRALKKVWEKHVQQCPTWIW